ncbi:hypothetical protein DRN34_00090 [Thermococci archaeon]|nr:MAG: hypothetical protein DRN34_00090 [Thermococci archaeon]
MKRELEEQLIKKYPNLYQLARTTKDGTMMAYGLSVGEGWYKIIDELSAKLEPLGAVAMQVKEKFGGLRFYIGGIDKDKSDEAYAAITAAEVKAAKTCESCGEPGERKGSGWVITMCDKCWADKQITNITLEK